MRPGTPLRLALGATLLALAVACGRDEAPTPPKAPGLPVRPVPKTRPSLVLIDVSGVRTDDVFPASGTPRLPTFAKFAADHTAFLQAQSPAAWELPSIAGLLTSLVPLESGVTGSAGRARPTLIPAPETLAELLRDEGYETAAFVGGGLVTALTGLDQGFPTTWVEGWRIENGAGTVAQWLASRPKDRPFFLFLHADATLPPVPADVPASGRQAFVASAHATTAAKVDAGLSAVLDAIAKAALPPDTITILVSDHGEALLERTSPALVSRGGGLFDEQVHVPLAIAAPGFLPPGRVQGSCSLLDVLPTMRDAMGLPPARGIAGRSLRPLADNPSAPGLPVLAQEWRRETTDTGPVEKNLYGVRTSRVKWMAAFVNRPPSWTEQVYDLEADPKELRPLPGTEVARFGKEFLQAVESVREVLKGSRRHLSNDIVAPYLAAQER